MLFANQKLSSNSNVTLWFEQFEIFVQLSNLIVEPEIAAVAEDANRQEEETRRLNDVRNQQIEHDKQLQWTQILLINMEMDMFSKSTNLSRPVNIRDMEYKQLKQRLLDHFAPKPTKIASRYHFTQLRQKQGEKSSLFFERLMVSASEC